MVDLGTLGGGARYSEAYSINALGQIAGYSYTPDNTRWHAVLWQPDGAIAISARSAAIFLGVGGQRCGT
jgi:uncharacterized membrane protein